MTPAQLATLKAYIASVPYLNSQGVDGDSLNVIVDTLNAPTADYYVWRSSTPMPDISNAITWASLTPSDAADGTALFTNRALICQAKQINLQMLVQGQQSVASGKALIRGGFQDALQNLPSGVGGANLGAGWATVKTAMTRFATLGEKVLTTGAGTAATPADLGFEGMLTRNDVDTARRS